jgi:hypothetical protein
MRCRPSVDVCGYWQHARAAELSRHLTTPGPATVGPVERTEERFPNQLTLAVISLRHALTRMIRMLLRKLSLKLAHYYSQFRSFVA